MKNSLLFPIYFYKGNTLFTSEEIKNVIIKEKSSGLFNFKLLNSSKTYITISYNMVLVPLLHLKLSDLNIEHRPIGINIRFANILFFVYISQMVISIVICVTAIYYLGLGFSLLFLIIPIIVWVYSVINFKYLKSRVLKILNEKRIFFKKII